MCKRQGLQQVLELHGLDELEKPFDVLSPLWRRRSECHCVQVQVRVQAHVHACLHIYVYR